MLNLSGIRRGVAGRLLRLPLRLLPREMVLPVMQGRLRGKKWVVGSFNHGCWLGSYEFEKQALVAGLVRPGAVFFDIGAHVGFYTLLAATLVGDSGKVFAFEPLPRNQRYLDRHLHLNRLTNVTVFRAAVGDHSGEAIFEEGAASAIGHLRAGPPGKTAAGDHGELRVQLLALDDLYAQGRVPLPDYMKIDVEGAEADVLAGGRRLLSEGRPTIFLATHGPDVHRRCLELLRSMGYSCSAVEKGKLVESCDEILATKDAPGVRNPSNR